MEVKQAQKMQKMQEAGKEPLNNVKASEKLLKA